MSTTSTTMEQRAVCEKLRWITDQPWARQGSQLGMSVPLQGQALRETMQNMKEFGLEPNCRETPRGVRLELAYNHACNMLADVTLKDLMCWAKGVD